jgi:hypothetical protein
MQTALLDRLIGNLQPAIDDAEGLAELLLGDDERRIGEEVIPPHECEESLLTEELAERAISGDVPLNGAIGCSSCDCESVRSRRTGQ